MERAMSEQTSILDSIGRLESAIDGWRSLAESNEWVTIAWLLDSPDRDPRQIIAAYAPDNPLGGRYRHDSYTAASLRASFAESDYRRALAVEEALNEHGPAVAAWLDRQRIPGSESMTLFLGYRQPKYAAGLPHVLALAKVQALAFQQTESAGQQADDAGQQTEYANTTEEQAKPTNGRGKAGAQALKQRTIDRYRLCREQLRAAEAARQDTSSLAVWERIVIELKRVDPKLLTGKNRGGDRDTNEMNAKRLRDWYNNHERKQSKPTNNS
jgi:hypothetical protein